MFVAKKAKKKSDSMNPMLLKGMVIGLALGLMWMFYVNVLKGQYEETQEAVQGVYDSAYWE